MSKYSNDFVYVFLSGPEGVAFLRKMRRYPGYTWQDGPSGVALYSTNGSVVAQWVDIDRSTVTDFKENRLVSDHCLAVKAEAIRAHAPEMNPKTKETLAYVTSRRKKR